VGIQPTQNYYIMEGIHSSFYCGTCCNHTNAIVRISKETTANLENLRKGNSKFLFFLLFSATLFGVRFVVLYYSDDYQKIKSCSFNKLRCNKSSGKLDGLALDERRFYIAHERFCCLLCLLFIQCLNTSLDVHKLS